jgi:hypothetical protein
MSNRDNVDTGQQFAGMNMGAEPLKDEKPEQGFVQAHQDTGRLIIIGVDVTDAAITVCKELVKAGNLTEQALDNVKGSQVYIQDGNFVMALYGKEPFSPDAFKPSQG